MNRNPKNGFSLVEVLVVMGIMGVMMAAMMTMQSNMVKSNNFLIFQVNRAALKSAVMGQFLNNTTNCKCLFAGAPSFPTAGIADLGLNPADIHAMNYSGSCGASTALPPLVSTVTPIDQMTATVISVKDLVNSGVNQYSGRLSFSLMTSQEVIGPKQLEVSIPIAVTTVPGAPGMVTFDSCSMSGGGGATRPHCRLALHTFDNDNCTGSPKIRYTEWSDNVPISQTAWNLTSTGAPGSRTGMNWHIGDIACMRAGIECQ